MAKTTRIDRIEIDPDTGTVSVRFMKLSSDGEPMGAHRMTVPADGDLNAYIQANVAHLGTLGFAAPGDWSPVFAHAAIARTPENVEAAKARTSRAKRGLQR